MKKCTLLFGAALLAILSASAGNDIVVKAGEVVNLFSPTFVESKTWTFEDGTLEGWTRIDADGDTYNWRSSKDGPAEVNGYNNSLYCVFSQSYDSDNGTALTPDNYLVAPMKVEATANSYITFYAAAQDNEYYAEHFGVAVSTTGNKDAADFTTIADWTYGGVGAAGAPSQDKAKRSVAKRALTQWLQYRVDLSKYAGQEIWVALRHFDCKDQWYIDVDDITIGNYYEVIRKNEAFLFEYGTLDGWTTIDADGDGHNWRTSKDYLNTEEHGYESKECVLSHSYYAGALTPDNYLVSPQTYRATIDSDITFYATVTNKDYSAEHFGVAVSTTGNTDAADFTTIAEFTYGAKGVAAQSQDKAISSVVRRNQGEWLQYKVDLSQYAGDDIWIAIRHFGCTNQSILQIDHIRIENYSPDGEVDWICDNPTIGIPAFGLGRIQFVALNDTSGLDVVANITANPSDWNEYSFAINVQPLDAAVVPVDDLTVKDGDKVDVDLTVAGGFSVEWTNDNPSIGLAASGEGNISFDVVNNTDKEQVANISVNACKDVEGGKAYGCPMKFKVTVAPNESGIAEITADADTDAVYYNISGVEVRATSLTPGIYVRLRGDKSDKVIVK